MLSKMNKLIIILFILISTQNLKAQMDTLNTSLTISHIVKYPKNFNSDDTLKLHPLILTLHGHGSNENDLIGLAPHLQEELFWVSGRGQHTLRLNSYDWYQLPPTPEKIAATLDSLNRFIEELIEEYPVDTNHIYLMGFSQGSMIALSYAMAYPERLAGVIAQSGAIPASMGLEINSSGLKGKPIIITHGIEDPAMPVDRAREARDTLVKLETELEYNEFHMGHTISPESLQSVNKWLAKQLKKEILWNQKHF